MALVMRRASLLLTFLLSAVASGSLVHAVRNLVPERPPPVRPIELNVSTSSRPAETITTTTTFSAASTPRHVSSTTLAPRDNLGPSNGPGTVIAAPGVGVPFGADDRVDDVGDGDG